MDLSNLGSRHAVRFTDDDGRLTDVTGRLLAAASSTIQVQPDDGPARLIERSRIVAARAIPPRPVRPSSSVEKVQRLALRGWPGTEVARLGGWVMRAGGGFTRRANSALPLGDPGMPLTDALGEVERFYLARNLEPAFQIPQALSESPDAAVLGGLLNGWRRDTPTFVMVADLRTMALPEPDLDTSTADLPDDAWSSVYHYRGDPLPDAGRRVLQAAPAAYLTLHRDGSPVAIARLAMTDDWAGLTAVEVQPGSRGQGLGRTITTTALRHARDLGARFGYLQVVSNNHVALGLYRSLGFTLHHQYHYRVQPRS